MFKRVDTDVEEELEGFSYEHNGSLYKVEFDAIGVHLLHENDDPNWTIEYNEIPLLVKALQAAYNHKKGI